MLKIANNGNFEKSSYLSSFKIYRAETLNLSSLQIYLLQTIVKNRKNWPKIVKKLQKMVFILICTYLRPLKNYRAERSCLIFGAMSNYEIAWMERC